MSDMESLTNTLAAVLKESLSHGFRLPLRLVAMGANGGLIAVEYLSGPAGLQAEVLCQSSRERVTLPVNIYVSDADNTEAALVRLETNDADLKWVT